MDIDSIRHDMPKKLIAIFDILDRMHGMVKETTLSNSDYLSIAIIATEHCKKMGARRDGRLFYRGILLKKGE